MLSAYDLIRHLQRMLSSKNSVVWDLAAPAQTTLLYSMIEK